MTSELRQLQSRIDAIRQKLGLSERGEVVYFAHIGVDDQVVVAEADGFGGAVVKVIEGNYPIDFFTSQEESYSKEADAIEAARSIV